MSRRQKVKANVAVLERSSKKLNPLKLLCNPDIVGDASSMHNEAEDKLILLVFLKVKVVMIPPIGQLDYCYTRHRDNSDWSSAFTSQNSNKR